ncbi:MAG: bifunctional oligoribonuclease/PAP phosphatase NrnA [Verrucomicrobia bacterium]|nr:bifunctional oligoribonuclease/PAP phosphatase NrnA [Verrucomicrobiota bacterium]
MNDVFAAFARLVGGADRILVLSHMRPDGDAIGSQLALALALRKLGKTITAWNEDGLPDSFAFLPDSDLITRPPQGEKRTFDLVVVADTASKSRVGVCLDAIDSAAPWVNIDHHASNPGYGDLNLVDAAAPATGQVVFEILQSLRWPLDESIADALFLAISTDTGSFRYRNTSDRTFEVTAELVRAGVDVGSISQKIYESYPKRRVLLLGELLQTAEFDLNDQIASFSLTLATRDRLGIVPTDTDGLIDVVRSVETVIVAIFFEELPGDRVRISVRSKDPRVDVNKICAEFGGGGHQQAAGARIRGKMPEVRIRVINRVKDEISQQL